MSKNVLKIIDDLSKFEERCDEVVTMVDYQKAKSCVSDLKDTLKANPDIIALAAPQIGVHERIFVARFGKQFKVFLNPIVVNMSKTEFLSEETSVYTRNPKRFIIHRPEEITLAYQDASGNVEQMTFKKMTVVPILQMVDLLDGVLKDVLYYTALELDDSWDSKTKDEKETIIKNYEEMVKQNASDFEEQFKKDEELMNYRKQIEFNAKYLTGEIKPVDKEGNIVDFSKKEESTTK